ncbi:hypothetical protein Glove_84g160 [Diversispora epigaea]|uniref:Programmed cell death protein 5 n=1 Tax=Diversispora epigaea TaxID=1348612 RepID=A0A397J7D2_9GLOM|nr:hypothetical protein Glove_84g160 [Diversispora epigaea]
MEDSELQAIRQARLRELQAGATSGSEKKSSEDEGDKKRQLEEARQTTLAQILDNEARERLARISMVKVDKARAVEDLLIRMAQTGQLRGKVSESQLIDLLEQINQQQKPETKITYSRLKTVNNINVVFVRTKRTFVLPNPRSNKILFIILKSYHNDNSC